MRYTLRPATLDEVETVLKQHSAFVGAANPEANLRLWQRLSPAQQQEGVEAFIVAAEGERLVAGAHLHPGGFLTDLFALEDDALKVLLQDLRKYPEKYDGSYAVNLADYSPKVRARLTSILGRAGYRKTFDYQLKCELIRLDDLEPLEEGFIGWTPEVDGVFRSAYEKLSPNPWPWTIITQQAGGGKFNPELWFAWEDTGTLLGINEPANNRTQGRVFNTVVALGDPDRLVKLMLEALRRAASEDPIGVVNAHVGEDLLPRFETIGFEKVASHPVYVV